MKEHDISAGIVRLNFDLLLHTANIAVGTTKTEVERQLSRLQHASFGRNHREMKYAARELARNAAALESACETLHALEESRSREELKILRVMRAEDSYEQIH
ncbi:MAG TPA: hypothetical protein VGY56_02495 [Verrucomicrobiae bacterium]|nr:hypothetical protein [Verrucomicrobiae bacterium]